LLGVKDLGKQPNVWCVHVKPGRGCGIYETRPESCRSFSCLWLSTPSAPEALRPDKIKGVSIVSHDGRQNVILLEAPEYPGLALAAMKPLLDRYISDGQHYYVVVSGHSRKRTYFGNPALMAEAIAMLDAILLESQT
jgi:hypothetical protein